jgi:hypothetical protein
MRDTIVDVAAMSAFIVTIWPLDMARYAGAIAILVVYTLYYKLK